MLRANIRKWLLYSLVVILGLLTSIIILSFHSNSLSRSNPITMKEAYDLTNRTALDWNAESQLVSIISMDSQNANDYNDGLYGKRRYWNVLYAAPNSSEQILYIIKDKKIENIINVSDTNSRDAIIDFRKINITSTHALEYAQNYFHLKPGCGWEKGYNYSLRNSNQKYILSVIGQDESGYFAKVYFDAQTGELISGEHKVPYGGLLYKGKDKIEISSDENIWIVKADLSPNFESDNTIIAQCILKPGTTDERPDLFLTNDGGTNWRSLNFNQYALKIMFSPNYKNDHNIYVITDDSVFISNNNGDGWNRIFNQGNIISFYTDMNKQAILTNDALFITDERDCSYSWNKIKKPSGVFDLVIDSDGFIYVCSNNILQKWANNEWVSIKIPFKQGIIKGLKLSHKKLICYNLNSSII